MTFERPRPRRLIAVLLALLALATFAVAQGTTDTNQPEAPAPTTDQNAADQNATDQNATDQNATDQNATDQNAAAAAQDDPVVVALGDTTEHLSDLQARFEIAIRSLAASQGVPMSDALHAQLQSYLPQYLEQRGHELVLLKAAKDRGLTADASHVDDIVQRVQDNATNGRTVDDVLQQGGFTSMDQLRAIVRESDLINQEIDALQSEVEVTDQQVQDAYEANKADYTQPETVCASHILVDTEDAANAVLKDLQGGADFAEEAKAKSTGPSAPQGGDLGCFQQGQMVQPFDEAAFKAEVGTPVGPVKTQFGYHVILVTKHTDAGVQPLSDVRDQVVSSLQQKAVDGKVQAMVDAAEVQTFPIAFPPRRPRRMPAPARLPGPAAPRVERPPRRTAPGRTRARPGRTERYRRARNGRHRYGRSGYRRDR